MNILIVDDEAPIRDWLYYCVSNVYKSTDNISTATNGEQALEIVEQKETDIIFTDIKMPVMDGLELTKIVKERFPHIYVVILTNYADFSYAQKAISFDAFEYIIKSEMRADDISGILKKIENSKQDIIYENNQSFYKSIDISNNVLENMDEIIELLPKNGFKSSNSYSVLTFKKARHQGQLKLLKQLIAKENHNGTFIILEGTSINYLIVQCNSKHKGYSQKLAKLFWDETKESVVSGRERSKTAFLSEELATGKSAIRYANFLSKNGVIHYDDYTSKKTLVKSLVKEGYDDITSLISNHDNSKDWTLMLSKWFSMFNDISIDEIELSISYCRRMLLFLQELYNSKVLNDQDIPVIRNLDLSLDQYSGECNKLINEILESYQSGYSSTIEGALQYIHNHYHEDISLISIAEKVFRSPEYFSRLFKKEVGENFSSYLSLYRLNKARELLLTTDMKIYEISYEVGYTSPSYFSKAYKRYMGKNPDDEKRRVYYTH